jgi:hypothetical protein
MQLSLLPSFLSLSLSLSLSLLQQQHHFEQVNVYLPISTTRITHRLLSKQNFGLQMFED